MTPMSKADEARAGAHTGKGSIRPHGIQQSRVLAISILR